MKAEQTEIAAIACALNSDVCVLLWESARGMSMLADDDPLRACLLAIQGAAQRCAGSAAKLLALEAEIQRVDRLCAQLPDVDFPPEALDRILRGMAELEIAERLGGKEF